MGVLFTEGSFGCTIDVLRARQLNEEAAALGLADALGHLAESYEVGPEDALAFDMDLQRALSERLLFTRGPLRPVTYFQHLG